MRNPTMLSLWIMGALLLACRTTNGTAAGPYEPAAEQGMAQVEEPVRDFSAWNTDADENLSRDEFDAGIQNLFEDWDDDGDDLLAEQEFGEGIWEMWDVDDDGVVTQNEWKDPWFGGTYGEFGTWDADDDGMLTQSEFDQVWEGSGLFTAWDEDSDESLAGDEFADNVWESWNIDDDPFITQNEWVF